MTRVVTFFLLVAGIAGAAVFLSEPDCYLRARYPLLARAILAGGSAQIRNMATVAGNILQRTRCPYFYDVAGSRCNRRHPGQGCDAIDGHNRDHAILGGSPACVATHPSDMSVALAALRVRIFEHRAEVGARGEPGGVPPGGGRIVGDGGECSAHSERSDANHVAALRMGRSGADQHR